MRVSMSIIKNEHGVYHVRKKVPKALEEAVAQVTCAAKSRVAWLKKTLGTKDLKKAKILAKPVLMEFDRILAKAEALKVERPLRTTLSDKEIDRIAEYHFAAALAEDEEMRREGTGSEPLFQSVAKQLSDAGVEFTTQFHVGSVPEFGLSEREMQKYEADLEAYIALAEHALARGNVSAIREQMEELLFIFQLNLDPKSDAFRKLRMAVLRKDVEALRAIERRHKGEPVETPKLATVDAEPAPNGETLGAALEGWKKSKNPRPYALREFTYAINRFIELHGDMPVQAITRKTVREFREALQQMPLRRVGSLRRATLLELVEWSSKHPEAQKVSAATVNKLLGAAQAVAVWARNNGLIPDDVPWADPFSRMRLEEAEPGREPWEARELRVLFGSPVFTEGVRPKAGGGEAAFWLPLLGIFTGARLGELAPLTTADVVKDDATGILTISIIEDVETGKRLKTVVRAALFLFTLSLFAWGWFDFVEKAKRERGRDARAISTAQSWTAWWIWRGVVEMVRPPHPRSRDHKQASSVPFVPTWVQRRLTDCQN